MLRSKAGHRFTLLLLEEGEDYIDDFNAYAKAPACVWEHSDRVAASSGRPLAAPSASFVAKERKLHGKLRVCTKSIFFDPFDITEPIVRCETQTAQIWCMRFDCDAQSELMCTWHLCRSNVP